MTLDSLDNRMLDLLYDELDEASAQEVRAELARDPTRLREFEMLSMTRQIVDSLDDTAGDPQPLGHLARANILREARLTADRVQQSRTRRRAAWLRPTIAAFAAVLLIATIFVLLPALETSPPSSSGASREGGGGALAVTAHGATGEFERASPELDASSAPPSPDPVASHQVGAPSTAFDDAELRRRMEATQQSKSPAKSPNPRPVALENDDIQQSQAKQQRELPEENVYGQTPSQEPSSLSIPDRQNVAQQKQSPSFPEDNPPANEVDNKAGDPFNIAVQDPFEPNLEQTPRSPEDLERLRSRARGNIAQGSNMGLWDGSSLDNEANTRVDPNKIKNFAQTAQGDPVIRDGGDASLDRGIALVEEGEHAAAIDAFGEALAQARGPEGEAQARYLRGRSHQALGHNVQAITDLRVIVERHPSSAYHSQARLSLAEALIAIDSVDAARGHLTSLAEGHGQIAEAARTQLDALNAVHGGGGNNGERLPAGKPRRKRAQRSESEKNKSPRLQDFDDAENAIVR